MRNEKLYKYPVVITIAGSDSGGGAGIQADLKTFSALGCFGTSAITAVTAQNTLGVKDIHAVPPSIVKAQIQAIMEDIRPEAIKIGMVHNTALAYVLMEVLSQYPNLPLVLDPVMISTSGHFLIKEETVDALKTHLFAKATVITPNIDEAAKLVGRKIQDLTAMKAAARELLETGCYAVLLKGGHLIGNTIYDVVVTNDGVEKVYESPFIASSNLHGTGCTLSSAIAAFLGLGKDLFSAIEAAREYVHLAIASGKDVKLGDGHGPLNHFFAPQPLQKIPLK